MACGHISYSSISTRIPRAIKTMSRRGARSIQKYDGHCEEEYCKHGTPLPDEICIPILKLRLLERRLVLLQSICLNTRRSSTFATTKWPISPGQCLVQAQIRSAWLFFLTIISSQNFQTASAISVAVMASAVYPEAQEKVQEELDTIIGSKRGQCQDYLVPWPVT